MGYLCDMGYQVNIISKVRMLELWDHKCHITKLPTGATKITFSFSLKLTFS